uniref:Uncharacterized protein n=1 Tax=Glossina palpalis gambiensis TaxID=67801 RepID=A0A1B0BPB8_9MUSC
MVSKGVESFARNLTVLEEHVKNICSLSIRRGTAVCEILASLDLVVLNLGSVPIFQSRTKSTIIDITIASLILADRCTRWTNVRRLNQKASAAALLAKKGKPKYNGLRQKKNLNAVVAYVQHSLHTYVRSKPTELGVSKSQKISGKVKRKRKFERSETEMVKRIFRRHKQRSVRLAEQSNNQKVWALEAYTKNYKYCLDANNSRRAVLSNHSFTQGCNKVNRRLFGGYAYSGRNSHNMLNVEK